MSRDALSGFLVRHNFGTLRILHAVSILLHTLAKRASSARLPRTTFRGSHNHTSQTFSSPGVLIKVLVSDNETLLANNHTENSAILFSRNFNSLVITILGHNFLLGISFGGILHHLYSNSSEARSTCLSEKL